MSAVEIDPRSLGRGERLVQRLNYGLGAQIMTAAVYGLRSRAGRFGRDAAFRHRRGALDWWWSALLAVGCGGLGGLANALIAGGDRFTVWLPKRREEHIEFGAIGAIIVGVVAALVAWAAALHEASVYALIGGCVLAGVGGSNYLTSQARAHGYQAATQQAATATEGLANVAESMAAGAARGGVEAGLSQVSGREPPENVSLNPTRGEDENDRGQAEH